MNLRSAVAGVLLTLAATSWNAANPVNDERPALRAALRTVTGSIVAVSNHPAEGGLQVVTVALETPNSDAGIVEVLLAPRQVLDEIEFTVEEGDAFRVRIFVGDEGPLKAHKAMNLTRGTMVRFRTLHGIPLWDSKGDWAGGGCRHRAVQGGGPRGRGPGR
jgi:hypothetical protein